MRIFVTGATGYIGRVVTERVVHEGHSVHGLSRNEKGNAQLRALGATPVRGELASLGVLRQESSEADAVLHLAFIHDFTMDLKRFCASTRPLRMRGVGLCAEQGRRLW